MVPQRVGIVFRFLQREEVFGDFVISVAEKQTASKAPATVRARRLGKTRCGRMPPVVVHEAFSYPFSSESPRATNQPSTNHVWPFLSSRNQLSRPRRRARAMAAVNVIEVLGISAVSWEDAAKEAFENAATPL
ncbi:dodecin domain-containing protein [Haladaptatus paucihalophilus]|uniref:dodecin domain-containing protein n=1 Tax=Haladaptatus paucihalophilus TaxID=367189 RepID=UPI00111200EF